MNNKILHRKESYNIQGAIFEVYKQLGSGFLESVYQECLEIEFQLRNIPFHSQFQIPLEYKGHSLSQKYIPDFACFDDIIIEIKAIDEISGKHKSQLINYLKASGCQLGFLVNFGAHPKVDIHRFINPV